MARFESLWVSLGLLLTRLLGLFLGLLLCRLGSFCVRLDHLLGVFSKFYLVWVILTEFELLWFVFGSFCVSPFRSFWLVLGRFRLFFVRLGVLSESFWLVLGPFGSFWVVLGQFRSPLCLFWPVLVRFG